MASGADEPTDRDSPEVPFSDVADGLGSMIVSVEEKIALCDVIFQDLLAVQKIVKEKGLCDASFEAEKKRSDFTL